MALLRARAPTGRREGRSLKDFFRIEQEFPGGEHAYCLETKNSEHRLWHLLPGSEPFLLALEKLFPRGFGHPLKLPFEKEAGATELHDKLNPIPLCIE